MEQYHLAGISPWGYIEAMKWEVEASDEFVEWYNTLDDDEGKSVDTGVDMLEVYGPSLHRPYADTLSGSKYANMKELRIQHRGRPYRILFAFDPRRNTYLILGGDKTGKDGWYAWAIPKADKIYAQYIREIGE